MQRVNGILLHWHYKDNGLISIHLTNVRKGALVEWYFYTTWEINILLAIVFPLFSLRFSVQLLFVKPTCDLILIQNSPVRDGIGGTDQALCGISHEILTFCYGLNCIPTKMYVEVLTPDNLRVWMNLGMGVLQMSLVKMNSYWSRWPLMHHD